MEFRRHRPDDSPALEKLFAEVFSDSEGEAEGALIAKLAREMIGSTDSRDLQGYAAVVDGRIVGAILFTRLTFEGDVEAFIMAPVAVHTDYQRKGIGQALIRHGLQDMKDRGVQFVITYGDPNYYKKVGFAPMSPELVQPPFALSQPQGWLGQSLKGLPISKLQGKCSCVRALDDPRYW